jgi:hypothetical protein
MYWFRSFALDGMWLPAFQIAFGSAIIIGAYRQKPRPEDGPSNKFDVSHLTSRRWQARLGWFMIAGALLTAILRLTR